MPPIKAILIPGNGCDDDTLDDIMWYPWLAEKLRSDGVYIELPSFPDPIAAHEDIWKAFAIDQLGLDEDTLLIGHSSGAACALRLMETTKVFGCMLVAAYDDDLGDELERDSGYFSRPFDYEAMLRNVGPGGVIQFHSQSDHLVPVAVARRVSKGFARALKEIRTSSGSSSPNTADENDLSSGRAKLYEYVETVTDGHFQMDEYEDVMWPKVWEMLERR